jgi:hypothetical protein
MAAPDTDFAYPRLPSWDERGVRLVDRHHYILCLPHSNGYPLFIYALRTCREG